MTKREHERRARQQAALTSLGFTQHEIEQLRRIGNTLQRWYEQECGTENWLIEREESTGKPYRVYYAKGDVYKSLKIPVPDREAGAKRRLSRILGQRNGRPAIVAGRLNAAPVGKIAAYIQTDPRGAALYLLRPGDVPAGEPVESCYSRGIAVY